MRFRVDLTNDLPGPALIHWHGRSPHDQDGGPDIPMLMLQPGEARACGFDLLGGTYWMHSHVPMQEIRLLAAPLIVRSASDAAADRQEVVLFLHDFAFKSAEEVMEEIRQGHGGSHAEPARAMDHVMMGTMGGMQGMSMDLNDHDWDAYLANDRTLVDPEVVTVERGGRIRLRVINAAAATVFWIDTGSAPARLVAVDGHDTSPVDGSRLGLAMGQRLDLEIDLPDAAGSWPILALREGAHERTGIILVTVGAPIAKIPERATPAFDIDLSQELRLRARDPLPERAVQCSHMVVLGGIMKPYVWTINGPVWGEHHSVMAKSGEHVLLHCHHMPHLETGMMTEFQVQA